MLFDRLEAQVAHNQTTIYSFGSVFVLYLCWRLWSFTIRPYLRPDDPQTLPYWIPGFGEPPMIDTMQHLSENAL